MTRRVFLIHRWGATPSSDWYSWFEKMLVSKDIEVFVLKMPNTKEPRILSWVSCLSEAVGIADSDTYFVGHSIGCQTIIRYLESIKTDIKIGGAVFVAGWFHLIESSLETEKEKEIAAEWINSKINFKEVRKHIEKSVACFSDNDPYVPLSESKIFEKEIGSKIVIHTNRGHFTQEDGVSEMHLALNEVLKMIQHSLV